MIIERIQTIERFAELRDEWNALLRASRSDCVFLTHEWLMSWWKHLAGGRSLSILIARLNDELVGIFPLSLRPAQYMRMIPRSFEFLGSGIVGSDYLDVIVRPGHERKVLRSFAECLGRMGLVLHLNQVKLGYCSSFTLTRHLQREGWTVRETKINVCPFIDLHGHNWESYLGTLSSNQRYNFNRRLKNLMKTSEIGLECVKSPGDAQNALEILIALHRKRWGQRRTSEAFQTDEIIAFHREFIELAAQRDWLRLLILRAGKVPIAALYGFRYGQTFYFYQTGFDPAYSKQSVGLVMMGLAIKSAIDEGIPEYDLLHGGEEYKFHWAREVRELGRIELYPRHARAHVYRHAVNFNRAARKMARRVLKKDL
jgi:CelD/BcsL family acetyltransferase involved in cellulose biosynthesis